MQPLTDRQREILDLLIAHERTIIDLTVRDICKLTGIRSLNGVIAHLKALERKGYITREPYRRCGIQITNMGATND